MKHTTPTNPDSSRTFRVHSLAPRMVLALTGLVLAHSPLIATEADTAIENSAEKTYVFRTYLAEDTVKVSAKDGVVTLSGTVSDETHKALAQETVTGLAGVTKVDNQILVKAGPEERSDAWLHVKVKTALTFHRSVSAHSTKVEVKDGVVTLKGQAASEAARELTTEYAKDVIGVSSVKNEMTLAAGTEAIPAVIVESVDDASITAQVKLSLMAHRSTSTLRTSVATRDGVVTIGGNARSTAEPQLVTKLVNDIPGVKSVTNNMTVPAAKP